MVTPGCEPLKKLTQEEKTTNTVKNNPGTGTCTWCGGAWNWKKGHTVMLDEKFGFFICCEECWSVLSLENKVKCVEKTYVTFWMEGEHSLIDYIAAVKREAIRGK